MRYLQDNGLYFLRSSLSLFYKGTWHPGPQHNGYFETLVCHLLSQLAFQMKLSQRLASTPCLLDSLACHVVSRGNLD